MMSVVTPTQNEMELRCYSGNTSSDFRMSDIRWVTLPADYVQVVEEGDG